MGSGKETTTDRGTDNDIINEEHSSVPSSAQESTSDSETQCGEKGRDSGFGPKHDGNAVRLDNKSKRKRNRRKETKRNKLKGKSLEKGGVNAAGLTSKKESFEKMLLDLSTSIFCVQETKLYHKNQIKSPNSRNYTIFELLRKTSKVKVEVYVEECIKIFVQFGLLKEMMKLNVLK